MGHIMMQKLWGDVSMHEALTGQINHARSNSNGQASWAAGKRCMPRALLHSGRQTFLKLTGWVWVTTPSTLGGHIARARQIGETKSG